jgi:hypothetical protein
MGSSKRLLGSSKRLMGSSKRLMGSSQYGSVKARDAINRRLYNCKDGDLSRLCDL